MPVETLEKPKAPEKKEPAQEAPERELETPETEQNEDPSKIARTEQARKMGVFFSPEAAIVLPTAIVLDILGVLFTVLDIAYGIGEIPSWVSDGVGIVFFGSWMLMRSFMIGKTKSQGLTGQVVNKRIETKKTIKKTRKMGRILKFSLASFGELLPLVGSLPCWTLMAYSELKS